jgi:hypothetical protein
LCANADKSHRLKPVITGESAKPRHDLPVIYMANKIASTKQDLFSAWFHNHFAPEVEKHQMYEPEKVKALLLLDNAPAHTQTGLLRSKDGEIKCLVLPPDISSLT